jgi:hypothetical protein
MMTGPAEGKRDMANQRKKFVTDGFGSVTAFPELSVGLPCAVHNRTAAHPAPAGEG